MNNMHASSSDEIFLERAETALPANLRAKLQQMRVKPDDEYEILLRCFLAGGEKSERLYEVIRTRLRSVYVLLIVLGAGAVLAVAAAVGGFFFARGIWRGAITNEQVQYADLLAGQHRLEVQIAHLRAEQVKFGLSTADNFPGRVVVNVTVPPGNSASKPKVWAFIYDPPTVVQPEAAR